MRGVLCAFLVAAMVAGVSRADESALRKPRELAAAGRHAQALEELNAVLARQPESVEAVLLKGVLLAESGRRKEAEQVFQDLARRFPQHPEPLNNLAVLYAQSGDYERSVEVLKQALHTHSSYATAYDNLTKVYGRLAGRAYDRALGQESTAPAGGPSLELLSEVDASRLASGRAAATPVARLESESPATPVPEPATPSAARVTPPSAPVVPAEPIAEFDAAGVVDMVRAWARAWSEQRADDYLAFYSEDFRPDAGGTRAAWTVQRRQRVLRPRFIEVELESIGVRQIAERRAQARFVQSYRSDRFSDRVTKTLDLVWEAGGWKIQGEMSRPN